MIRLVPPIFETSVPGRKGYSLPEMDVPQEKLEKLIPEAMLRKEKAGLLGKRSGYVRHFTAFLN